MFEAKNELYKDFAITDKAEIKTQIEEDKNVVKTLVDLGLHLADWWQLAKEDFSSLAPVKETVQENRVSEPMAAYISLGGDKIPKVRKLLDTIKSLSSWCTG